MDKLLAISRLKKKWLAPLFGDSLFSYSTKTTETTIERLLVQEAFDTLLRGLPSFPTPFSFELYPTLSYVAPSGLASCVIPFYVGFYPTLIYVAPSRQVPIKSG